jgi:hypothetical protein
MPDTRGLWTALTQGDVIGTQTQSSSPVSGPLFALIFTQKKQNSSTEQSTENYQSVFSLLSLVRFLRV